MAKDDKNPQADAQQSDASGETQVPTPEPRMRRRFQDEVLPGVMNDHGITNPMAAPKLDKIVLSIGVGRELDGTKLRANVREQVLSDLEVITGQKPVMRKAKRSVANFKLRAGYEVGAMVTLRGPRMWEFFDRLVNLAIPRIKDFRGISDKKFDGRGNFSFGINEQGIFPEVDMTRAQYIHGMNITLVFANSDNTISRELLAKMGFPFTKPDEQNAGRRAA
jgi:large subunit ribosomal protein L5